MHAVINDLLDQQTKLNVATMQFTVTLINSPIKLFIYARASLSRANAKRNPLISYHLFVVLLLQKWS